MKMSRSIRGMRRLPLVAAILVGLHAPAVLAQETTTQDADAQQEQQDENQ